MITEAKREYMRVWRAKNRERLVANHKEWLAQNREHVAAQRAEYQATRGNELNRLWAQANRPRIAERKRERYHRDPEHHREIDRQVRQRHLERYRFKNRQNIARIKARRAGVEVDLVDYEAILARDGYVCHICKGDVVPAELSFDHVIPMSKGGPHHASNIKVSHLKCNVRKGNKL